jgi:hypothetical protein
MCSVIAGVSQRVGNFILGVISIIIRLAFKSNGVLPTIDTIPKNIVTALADFDLDGHVTVYAVCPECHCTYKPAAHGDAEYPLKCSNQPRPGSGTCNADLLEGPVNGAYKPVKTFIYHEFNDYLASLLARSDIEQLMDDRCDELRDTVNGMDMDSTGCMPDSAPDSVKDIFEADFLKTFRGPSGSKLFVDRAGTEGRYAFSLNVDFFHPEKMHVRGAKTSVGLISMACLNLPLDIRYKPENMYLAGVIPGPQEPHLTELNHYLRPLIEDLKVSWTRGHRFSRTALHSTGRTVRAAIIACVADLPAARKVSQMSSARSHFYCSICLCYHLSTLRRTDYGDWNRRDPAELRRRAEEWRNASSLADQEKIFAEHGVRWSVMWDLPYWDPTRQLAVDSMHCLLEGIAHHHIRKVLCLTTEPAARAGIPAFSHAFKTYQPEDGAQPVLNDREIKQVIQIHKLLVAPCKDRLNVQTVVNDSVDSDTEAETDGAAFTDTDVETDKATTTGTDVSVDDARETGYFGYLHKQLVRKNLKALLFVCQGEIPGYSETRSTKAQLANDLIEWVGGMPHDHVHIIDVILAEDQTVDTAGSFATSGTDLR